jgi:selenocysteine-specific elongation factor
MSKVLPLIIGTAGHVDHGKTSLVKALTSFETDQHPEEKARGMSIDFAVAPFILSDGRVCGLLDVPGHEDFIRNMVSGASSIDLMLLVIAADDGIMPQTREHLRIAYHLGASRIIPVITKVDLTDQDQAQTVALEALSLISSYSIETEEPHFVSNTKGEGIDELRKNIEKVISSFSVPDEPEQVAFRMFIRTCFSSKGHGSIVTGVPSNGIIKIGEKVEIYPPPSHGESRGIVRNIQNYRSERENTRSHISSALNIRGIEDEAFERGSVLVSPDVFTPTKEIFAWIKNTSERPIARKRQYQLHIGTFKTSVVAYPLKSQTIEAGEEGFLRFSFEKPGVVLAGDRFLIREEGTIGGGVVLSSYGKLLKREYRPLQIAAFNKAFKTYSDTRDKVRTELLSHFRHFLTESHLSQITQSASRDYASLLDLQNDILKVGSNVYFNLHHKELFLKRLTRILSSYHSKNLLSTGMPLTQLAKLFGLKELQEENFSLIPDSTFTISKGAIALASHQIALSGKELQSLKKIESLLAKEPVIAKGNLLNELGCTQKEYQKLIKILQATDQVKSIDTYIFSLPYIEEIRTQVLTNPAFSNGFTLADFRKHTNLSRNYAVLLLEMFDGEGFTKRSGDLRIPKK